MEFFYTPKLRPHSEGIFITGDLGIFIPPRTESHVVDGTCSSEGSMEAFEKPFNVSSLILHMHHRGTSIK